MCTSQKLIKQSKNGFLTFCTHSKLFQLVFNNLCFELYEWELETLKNHVQGINVAYWEKRFRCLPNTRKIPFSVDTKHFMIMFDKGEVLELKKLLNIEHYQIPFLRSYDIDYKFIEN